MQIHISGKNHQTNMGSSKLKFDVGFFGVYIEIRFVGEGREEF